LTNHRFVYFDQLQDNTTTLKTVQGRPHGLEDSVCYITRSERTTEELATRYHY